MDRLNARPGTATDAMVLFLALNTAGFGLIPTTLLSLRVSAGSAAPASILVPTLDRRRLWAPVTAVLAATLLARLPLFRLPPGERAAPGWWRRRTPAAPPMLSRGAALLVRSPRSPRSPCWPVSWCRARGTGARDLWRPGRSPS
jgi:hypothetical protein